MGGDPSGDKPRAFDRLQTMPSVASGRALMLSMLVLIVCDMIGGFLAVASGVHSWNAAWGFDAKTTVPLPIGAAQLLLAWLAARNMRPPVGPIAAILLSAFCLTSLMSGLFDGDLVDNVASAGLISWEVVWAVVLLSVTAAVGLLVAPGRDSCTGFADRPVFRLADAQPDFPNDSVRSCRGGCVRHSVREGRTLCA